MQTDDKARRTVRITTIGKKIGLAFSALVALTIVLGTVSIVTGSQIKSAVNLLVVDSLPATVSVGRLDSLVKEQRAFALRHMLMETPEQKKQAEFEMAAGVSKFQAEMSAYKKTIATPRDRELFEKMTRSFEQFSRVWAKIQPISHESKQKEAVALWMAEGLPAAEAASKVAAEMMELNKAKSDASCAAAASASVAGQFWAAAVLGLAVVSGGLLAFFIVRGINSALMLAVVELGEGAQQVSVAASQVSGSSQSLAQGATEQAASLEETSASSEEMSSMTRRNAENSHQAVAFMNTMGARVAEANTTVAEMMTSMHEIDEASGKISKIIRLIDEIAFQTNILALNAAVEAARAGAAGMGFSVVAEEVRNLAQRSAQAAKDTAALVEDSILKSAEGTTKLDRVASSVRAITEGAGKVKTLVDEVEAASREQAQGIEQISKAVAQMDRVTQQTAANAEETAAASEELNAQSHAMLSVVGRLQALVGA